MRTAIVTCVLACCALGAPATRPVYAGGSQGVASEDGKRSQPAGDARSDNRLPSRWWTDERYARELKLTPDQKARIDRIFQESMDRLKVEKDELDRAQGDFGQLMKKSTASERELLRAADLLEVARFSVSKERTSMLVRIHTVLNAEQRLGLQAILKRSDGERNNRSR